MRSSLKLLKLNRNRSKLKLGKNSLQFIHSMLHGKPGLQEQFLCETFYVTNVFDLEDCAENNLSTVQS